MFLEQMWAARRSVGRTEVGEVFDRGGGDHVPPEVFFTRHRHRPLRTTGRPMVRIHQAELPLIRLTERIPVSSKSHHPDPHHRDSDIWQGAVCRRNAGRKEYRVPDCVCDEATYMSCVDAKHRPEGLGSDVVGMGKATSGSLTDKLTREHRLTLDEAHLILNAKKEDSLEQVIAVSAESRVCSRLLLNGDATSQRYEHLFKQNSLPEVTTPAKPVPGKRVPVKYYSHYLQSKVVRAKERIEAEHKLQSTSSEPAPQPTPESPPPNP